MDPCYQGYKMTTGCWNNTVYRHILLSSQSQCSLPTHPHCSTDCTRCTDAPVLSIQTTTSLAKRFIFYLVQWICWFYIFLFFTPTVALFAALKDIYLTTCSATWSHTQQLQFVILASSETSSLLNEYC